MFVIRPIRAGDIDALEEIAMSATLGITSLPKNRASLEKKLEHALASFEKEVSAPENELYLFVIENSETKTVGGTTAIVSKTGVESPAYFYNVETVSRADGDRRPELKILHPTAHINGPSEICSLFLKKEFRHEGLGKLLSFCRFLFIAAHPERFDSMTIAEMRGVIKDDLSSPLWSSLGHHFYRATFLEAMEMRDKEQFRIADIIPEYPIYVPLLTKAAQEVIGKVHPNTKPALKMLKEQGFSMTNEIDLFDGGPKIEASTAEIKAVKKSTTATIGSIEESVEGDKRAVISNNRLDFRCCEGFIKKQKNGKAILPRDVAEALGVEIGDTVRYYKG